MLRYNINIRGEKDNIKHTKIVYYCMVNCMFELKKLAYLGGRKRI